MVRSGCIPRPRAMTVRRCSTLRRCTGCSSAPRTAAYAAPTRKRRRLRRATRARAESLEIHLALLPLLLDELRVRALLAVLLVEVLELREVLSFRDQRLESRRVLADAVPAAH